MRVCVCVCVCLCDLTWNDPCISFQKCFSEWFFTCLSFFFVGNRKFIFIMNLDIYCFFWLSLVIYLICNIIYRFSWHFVFLSRSQFVSVVKFLIVAESSLLKISIRISFCCFDSVQLLDCIFHSSFNTVL